MAAVKQQQMQQQKAAQLGSQIEAQQLADMTSQLKEFKENLEQFALKHKKEISKNPVFRGQFLKMCRQIGVDPLSSNKGYFADVLGVGDFYYEIAVSFRILTVSVDLNREHLYCSEAKEWRFPR